jgi:hypothetical protein
VKVEVKVEVEIEVEVKVEVQVEIERTVQLTMQVSTQPTILLPVFPDEQRRVLRGIKPRSRRKVPVATPQVSGVRDQGGNDQALGPDDQWELVLGFRGSRVWPEESV